MSCMFLLLGELLAITGTRQRSPGFVLNLKQFTLGPMHLPFRIPPCNSYSQSSSLAGLYLLKSPDVDDALHWSRCPTPRKFPFWVFGYFAIWTELMEFYTRCHILLTLWCLEIVKTRLRQNSGQFKSAWMQFWKEFLLFLKCVSSFFSISSRTRHANCSGIVCHLSGNSAPVWNPQILCCVKSPTSSQKCIIIVNPFWLFLRFFSASTLPWWSIVTWNREISWSTRCATNVLCVVYGPPGFNLG